MKYYRLYSPHYEADQTITEQNKAGVSPNKQKALLPEKKKEERKIADEMFKDSWKSKNMFWCFRVYFSLNSLSWFMKLWQFFNNWSQIYSWRTLQQSRKCHFDTSTMINCVGIQVLSTVSLFPTRREHDVLLVESLVQTIKNTVKRNRRHKTVCDSKFCSERKVIVPSQRSVSYATIEWL